MPGKSEKSGKKPRGPGKRFQKGVSGNPSGRPAVPDEVREELRAIFAGASPAAANALVTLLKSKDGNLRHKAAESILKRVLGDEVLVKLEGKLDVKDVTDARDNLARKLSALAASLAAGAGGAGRAPDGDGS